MPTTPKPDKSQSRLILWTSLSALRSEAGSFFAKARSSFPVPLALRKFSQWLMPLAPADQHLVGGGLEGEAQAEEPVERGVRGAPAVEPEHELVEVDLQVL